MIAGLPDGGTPVAFAVCTRLHTIPHLRVPPARCTLVEDTLVHQKAARCVGMRTVWMQRWLPSVRLRTRRRPVYVDRRVRRLQDLG